MKRKQRLIAFFSLVFVCGVLSASVSAAENIWYVHQNRIKTTDSYGLTAYCNCYSVSTTMVVPSSAPSVLMGRPGSYDYAVEQREKLSASDRNVCPGCSAMMGATGGTTSGTYHSSYHGEIKWINPQHAIVETDDGRWIGERHGNTFTGVWVERDSQKRCKTKVDNSYHWGRLKLTFSNDQSRITGYWSYCDKPPKDVIRQEITRVDYSIPQHILDGGGAR